MTVSEIMNLHKEDTDAIISWADDIYSSMFADHFLQIRELYNLLKNERIKISDEDLEHILSDIPLKLFAAAENLNNLRLRLEVSKMKAKQAKREASEAYGGTKSDKAEYIKYCGVEEELVTSCLQCVISRVESEMSFSRELIMSAKKIWDGRRPAEATMPVKETSTHSGELPEYKRQRSITGDDLPGTYIT